MLPSLTNWDETAHSLHRATEPLAGITQMIRPHARSWLELALAIRPDGLSTGKLAAGGEIFVNFKRAALIYQPAHGAEVVLTLNGQTQATLFQALLEKIAPDDLQGKLASAPQDKLVQGVADALAAEGHDGHLFNDGTPLKVDAGQASDYADALYAIFTGVARFRARLVGHLTPVVVWPEHFDLSTLWYKDGDMDEMKAQLNFGFAPFSEGLPRPYLYVTAYPMPKDTPLPSLPAPARWWTEGWTGVVVDYDDLAQQADPAQFVEQICLDIFDVVRPLLG
jgi:hypothetical protein